MLQVRIWWDITEHFMLKITLSHVICACEKLVLDKENFFPRRILILGKPLILVFMASAAFIIEACWLLIITRSSVLSKSRQRLLRTVFDSYFTFWWKSILICFKLFNTQSFMYDTVYISDTLHEILIKWCSSRLRPLILTHVYIDFNVMRLSIVQMLILSQSQQQNNNFLHFYSFISTETISIQLSINTFNTDDLKSIV